MDIIIAPIVTGTGATAIMDLWLAFLKRWHVPSLDYALLGRWIAALLLGIWGPAWLERPTLGPALIVSTGTLVAPFLVMQPAMGAGFAASKTLRPHVARLRSLVTHTVYGLGLYASALLWALMRSI